MSELTARLICRIATYMASSVGTSLSPKSDLLFCWLCVKRKYIEIGDHECVFHVAVMAIGLH